MLKQHKFVGALPVPLEADSIYYVRSGEGFDIYVTNGAGMIVAYPLNQSGGGEMAFSPVTLVVTSAGQTTFAVAGGYTPGALMLTRNGALLSPSQYTASNGVDVVLNTGAATSEALVAYVFKTFEVADAQPLSPMLTALSQLQVSANTMIYFDGTGVMKVTTLTPAARQLLDDATFEDMKNTLGVTGGGGGPSAQVGDVLYTANAPASGYLACNGAIYPQATYPALFAKVGLIGSGFGLKWVNVASPGTSNPMRGIATDRKGVWVAVGDNNALVRSADGGATWAAVAGAPNGQHKGVATDGKGVWIAVGSSGTIIRSTDNGLTWTAMTITGTTAGNFVAVATNGAGIWYLASSTGATCARSTDNGATWTVNANAGSGSINTVATDGNGIWIAVTSTAQVMRSDDNAVNWSLVATSSPSVAITALATDGSGVWIFCGNNGTTTNFRSNDHGLSWSLVSNGGNTAIYGMVADSRGNWIAVGVNGAIRRSTDAGLTWSAPVSANSNPLNGVAVDNAGQFIAAGQNGAMQSSAPVYTYDTATMFRVPDIRPPAGVNAYIKATA